MAEIGFGEFCPDQYTLNTTSTSYVRNVFPTVNGYGPMAGVNSFSQGLPSAGMGIFSGIKPDGGAIVFAGTQTGLYRMDGTTYAWSSVTRTSGGNYSLGVGEFWDFVQFGPTIIAASYLNQPQAFNPRVDSKFSDLPIDAPAARRVTVVGDFVVLAGIPGVQNRIQWSGINDYTSWTIGLNQSDYQDFPDGGEVQGISGGEVGIVFQERAIRRMIYTGPPDIFDFQKISENKGAFMRYSICRNLGFTYFYSNDGFYKIDLSGALTPIGANKVDRTVAADLDTTDQRNMLGICDPVNKRALFFYKSIAGTLGMFDKLYVYDWFLDRWSYAEISIRYAAPTLLLSPTLEGLDALNPSIDALPLPLDTFKRLYAQQIISMTAVNTVGYMNGANLEAIIDTPEGATGEGKRMFIRDLAPVGDASTAYLSVRYRDRLIDALVQSNETQIGVRGYAPQRVNARFNTVRVRVPAAATWSFMRSVDVNGRTGGRR